jgi:chlorite dismutase
VEAGVFEVAPHRRDDLGRLGRQRRGWMLDQAIDVVDAEPDALEMERGDRPIERLGFFDEPRELIVLRRHSADDGEEFVEALLRREAFFSGHGVRHCKMPEMQKGRSRIEPPDLSEKGGAKDGQPQRSDDRLFMQLLAFGGCSDPASVSRHLRHAHADTVVYEDVNDPRGVAVLSMTRTPADFVEKVRPALANGPCGALTLKPDYTMLGRTYSLGYEPDLNDTLIERPRRTVLNPEWPWAIWYPLRRSGRFAQLSDQEQRTILAEHGAIGMTFGAGDYAHDIRLACHGLDRDDNDFVIGLIGKELFPLSAVIQAMRKTQQTSLYLDRLGPFFVGHRVRE